LIDRELGKAISAIFKRNCILTKLSDSFAHSISIADEDWIILFFILGGTNKL
jgi:hypothetical protein